MHAGAALDRRGRPGVRPRPPGGNQAAPKSPPGPTRTGAPDDREPRDVRDRASFREWTSTASPTSVGGAATSSPVSTRAGGGTKAAAGESSFRRSRAGTSSDSAPPRACAGTCSTEGAATGVSPRFARHWIATTPPDTPRDCGTGGGQVRGPRRDRRLNATAIILPARPATQHVASIARRAALGRLGRGVGPA